MAYVGTIFYRHFLRCYLKKVACIQLLLEHPSTCVIQMKRKPSVHDASSREERDDDDNNDLI